MTLIELLVAVSIVGVLAALLLTGVAASRNAARRAQCVNNLRQLGVAIQNFQSAERQFPSGAPSVPVTLDDGTKTWAIRREHSPQLQILAYLEAAEVMNAVNMTLPFDTGGKAPENATARSVHLGVFLCPSETSPLLRGPTGPTSYRANMGPGPYLPDMSIKNTGDFPEGGAGAFVVARALRPQDFKDGLGSTVMMSEKLMGDDDRNAFSPSRDYWCAGLPGPNYPIADVLISICTAVPSWNPPHVSRGGRTWFVAGFDDTMYNHSVAPNSRVPGCKIDGAEPSPDRSGNFGGIFGASSQHGGGVNSLLGDSSVKFVKESISLSVWRALATRSGGEVISGEY